jgi:nucleotide-binding universal stress UspA family protein
MPGAEFCSFRSKRSKAIMKTKTVSRNGHRVRSGAKRLLVPVDFSDPSFVALRRAIDLAEDLGGASLTILYVVPSDGGWFNIGRDDFQDLDKALQKQAADELRAVVRTHVPPSVRADMEVRIGRPAEEIVAAASEANADAIVMSTHGRTGLDRYLIGSVAERVMHLSPCPVYLIPASKAVEKVGGIRASVLKVAEVTRPRVRNR